MTQTSNTNAFTSGLVGVHAYKVTEQALASNSSPPVSNAITSQQSGWRAIALRILKGKPKEGTVNQNTSSRLAGLFSLVSLTHLKDMFVSLFVFRIRLIPMVIFFAVLVLGARVSTLITHLSTKDMVAKAYASDKVNDTNQVPLSHLDQVPETKVQPSKLKAINEFDPFNMTADQYRVLRGIVDQSDALSDRERSLSEKEQILQALLKKMDEKVAELRKAKQDLETIVNQIDEDENANTTRLVKMVEGMKPPQAAAVLEDIEFSILLDIMERVKEKKAAEILANMEPKKAGYLMTSLSKRRKIFKKDNPSKSVMRG